LHKSRYQTMAQKKKTKSAGKTIKAQIRYEKSKDFKSALCTGAYGGVGQNGLINSTNIGVEQNKYKTLRHNIASFENCSKHEYPALDIFPSKKSIASALKVLDLFKSAYIFPYSIEPSLDGGIIFEYDNDVMYIVFEVTNNGEILYLRDEKGTESIKQLSSKELDKNLLN